MPKTIASKTTARLDLSQHLPYLVRQVHGQLEAASAGRLAQFGVNVGVWKILAVLWQHGELAHRALSELTSIEVSTLSRMSKTVQRDGLIRRTRTVDDQRTVRVTLTDKGRDLVQQIIPSALAMQQRMTGSMTPRDVQTVTRLLHVIAENFGTDGETDSEVPGVPKKVSQVAAPKTRGATKPASKTASRKRARRAAA